MVIFTSICANYLHKARTLSDSVKAQMPDATFVVCLLEREILPSYLYGSFDRVVLAKDSWEGNFNRFIFKHTIVEASTAVKGRFFKFLYEEYPNETAFIYLDPDIYVYRPFTELSDLLRNRPIVLCPHLLQPGNIDMELSSTAHGVYNLGFLAVNGSDEARKFIDWWAERLYLFCCDDIINGIFTDQKWIDLAPCFFDTEILKHHGYDFAPWSLLDCNMTEESGEVLIHGDPLRFIHFSGYGRVAEDCMNKWLPGGYHPFRRLYDEYALIHNGNDSDNISKTPWSYAKYLSGEEVTPEIRNMYRKNYEVMFMFDDPFSKSNKLYKKLLKNNKNGESGSLRGKIGKAFEILRSEGLFVLIRKIKSKLMPRR